MVGKLRVEIDMKIVTAEEVAGGDEDKQKY